MSNVARRRNLHAGLVLLVLAFTACGPGLTPDEGLASTRRQLGEERPRGADISVHTTMGMPDEASTSLSNSEHYLSVKAQYVVSYNGQRKTPNWVSWQLNSTSFGSARRQDDYRADDTLPRAIPQARLADYKASGYDRGHLCASAERRASETDNSSTFYLTNMVPQAANNNRGPWVRLEEYEIELAKSGNELFITAGGIYDSRPRSIGKGVAVPVATFKVVVVLDSRSQGAEDVNESTRVVAVIVPNDDDRVEATEDWRPFRTTVRDIERQTGLDLLSDVQTEVQDVVETRVDVD
jgi:endonuclease G